MSRTKEKSRIMETIITASSSSILGSYSVLREAEIIADWTVLPPLGGRT